ncbi:MAG: M48 family metalloprotease [Neomegalonema sp.]|nr:M48 family metalloprotease [Neomegalonema sp.]
MGRLVQREVKGVVAAMAAALLLTACAAPKANFAGTAPQKVSARAAETSVTRGRVASVGWEAYDRYEDRRLHAYIAGVVAKLSANARLTAGAPKAIVVNAPAPNATAGPDNEIAITTGLLALLLDEAELAWVLAHEIAHVELGHPKKLASITRPTALSEIRRFAASRRRSEMAADRRGIELLRAAGYDVSAPRRLTQRLGGAGGRRIAAYLATHPTNAARLAAMPRSGGGARRVDAYFDAVDGLRFTFPGRLTIPVRAGVLVSPSLKLAMSPPPGYRVLDTGNALEFAHPDGLIRIRLKASPESGPDLKAHLHDLHAPLVATAQAGPLLDVKKYRSFNDRDALTGRTSLRVGGVTAEARLSVIQGDRRRFVLIALSPVSMKAELADALWTFEHSVRPIDADDLAVLSRLSVRVVTVEPGDDYRSILTRSGAAPIGETYFRFLNGLGPSARLRAGQKVKVVAVR